LVNKQGRETELVSKVPYHKVKAGDHLVSYGPCGGGYGDPLKRNPELVLSDVLDGLISAETALKDYGVVIGGNAVDHKATAAARSEAI
jgi:N-methylhydantoinase B